MENGMQTLFPLYLSRRPRKGEDSMEADSAIAQNENNLNQNFSILYNKVLELEKRIMTLETEAEPV